MKKKTILLIMLLLTFCACLFMATGCIHVCDVSEKVATEEYLKKGATCTTKPEYYYSCKCGEAGSKTFFLGSAKGHKHVNYVEYEQATCENNATLISTCENGCGNTHIKEVENTALGHKFTNYVSNNNATCKVDATGTATCDRGCGATDTKTLDNSKVEHKFEDYFSDDNATCMSDATKTARCVYGCGTKNSIYVAGTKKDHVYGEFVSDNNATCFENGTRSAYCKYGCGNYLRGEDVGSKLSHSFINYEYNENATCERDGTETAYCEHGCKTTDVREKVNSKKGHSYTNYVYNNDIDCGKDGTETAYCDNNCGRSHTRTIENSALTHDYGEWKSNGNDTHSKVCSHNKSHVITAPCSGGTATEQNKAICSTCHAEYGKVAPHVHNFSKQVVIDNYKVSDPTCQKPAVYYYSCACGDHGTLTFNYGAKVDHKQGEFTSNGDATCQKDGTETAHCIYGCGKEYTQTEVGSIKDHLFTTYVFNNNSTYEKDGTETAHCDFGCGASYTRTAVGSMLRLPEYTSDDQIEIFAYSTPTHAKWDGFENNPEGITDKVYSDMAKAGFTGVQALREGYLKTGSNSLNRWHEYAALDAINVMELCNKYGLKYMIRDWAFMGSFNIFYGPNNNGSLWQSYFDNGGTIESGLTEMFNIPTVKAATNNKAYAGHNLWDEPDIPQMEKLIPVVKTYKQLVPHGDPFFNLLPCYATEDQLGGTYEEYIAYYCKNIAPMLGYISYDYYPYSVNSLGVSKVSERYLYNFQIVAEYAKLYNLEFRLYIQAGHFGGDSRDAGGVEDYRHQMYTAMAFGVRYFIYFTYGYGMNDNGLVDSNLNPTAKYYYAQQANNEVHLLEDVMLNFNWQGIMYKNGSSYSPNAAFNHIKNFSKVFTSHARINSYTVSKDTVVGCFKDNENRDGFMFVNYVDPAKKQSDTVTVKFNNATKLIVYELGVRKVVELPASGEYNFTLSAGEGRFVIPIA